MNMRGNLKSLLKKIDSKLPEDWKYYTETAIGILLLIASLGALFLTPRSIISGLTFAIVGLYMIPEIRFRILFKLDIRPPRYSIPVLLVLGLMIAGFFSPQTAGGLVGSTFTAEPELNIEEKQPIKLISGTAEVRNNAAETHNYTIGISLDGELEKTETFKISSKESKNLKISLELQEQGEHNVKFYSSRSDVLKESNSSGFSIKDSVNLPNYLTEKNIESSVQEYSPIPQKDLSIIREVKISYGEEGKEVKLTNKADNTYGLYDVIKTATANSFHASKQIFQQFQNVSRVTVSTTSDFTYRNGTVEEIKILETGLSKSDSGSIDWNNMENQVREDYGYWINSTTSYEIEKNLCQGISKSIECSK